LKSGHPYEELKMSRKRFTSQEREQAVQDYTSGARTAQEIADDLGTKQLLVVLEVVVLMECM
jgi:transposase-like protein